MEIISYLSSTLGISSKQVKATLDLIDSGASIPFIARYKKEETGNLSDVILRRFEEEKTKFEKLEERKKTILSSISEQGKLTPELQSKIVDCLNLSLLETIYRPYKPKRKTRGSIARENGLEALAHYILKQNADISSLNDYAKTFVNEKVKDANLALDGALDIIAEEISDNSSFYLFAKEYIYRSGRIKAKETKEDVEQKYLNYDNFDCPLSKIKPYQTLALLRGKKEKKLTYSFAYDEITIYNYISRSFINHNSPFYDLLRKCIEDSYKRLMGPSIENEITKELFLKAEDSSLILFSKNLKQLLLAPPLKGKTILGFDPGYKNGCKLALINPNGQVLNTCIIYPTIGREKEAEIKLLSLYRNYKFDSIALGNGTASRESQTFLESFLKKNALTNVTLIIVNESGASVYSASPLAIKEFPNMDIDERSSVSLARRLLDPMAELVKIPPEAIGVGQYQHDMDESRLKETLSNTTIDAVNEVGVWLNTASVSLLKYVSGLNEGSANAIVLYRDEHGPFRYRKELLNVKGLGKKTFTDAAGFLRIENDNPLEKTAVHPKDYESTKLFLAKLGLSLDDLGKEKANFILSKEFDIPSISKEIGIGEYTLKDIIDELRKPGRDPREKMETANLDNDVRDIKDLKIGMLLNGTVRNLSDFGAFVDIGVHQDGLVHISEIASHFVSRPSDELELGQIIKVKVIGVDIPRKRISLSIKQASDNEDKR